MAGEKDLKTLLENLRPRLREGLFVFCTIDADTCQQLPVQPLGSFREEEGGTVIRARENGLR